MNQVKQIVDEIFGEIVTYRRELHKIPEIGFSEYKTADYICHQLDEMGIPYKRGIAKTGIVGFLKGNPGEKTLLMRADMDALPVTEENDCEFRSQHEGMMHACGHDAHMAILLGCAKVLSRLKDKLSCNIKFCFQPADEAIGGALPMIEEGILENPHVDAAVGGHVMNDVPAGKILVKAGEMMAAPDDFTLVVHGRGGLAARVAGRGCTQLAAICHGDVDIVHRHIVHHGDLDIHLHAAIIIMQPVPAQRAGHRAIGRRPAQRQGLPGIFTHGRPWEHRQHNQQHNELLHAFRLVLSSSGI